MVCHCRYHDSVLHIKLGWETDRFSFCSFPKCPSNHKITILRFKLARFRLALRAQITRNLFFSLCENSDIRPRYKDYLFNQTFNLDAHNRNIRIHFKQSMSSENP